MVEEISHTPLLILAGGLGTRLGNIALNTPKPMLALGERPFLSHLIDHYYNCGIREIYLLASHLSEQIEEFANNSELNFPSDLSIVVIKEDPPLGTGGAIKSALNHFSSENFFVVNGDTFVDTNLDELVKLGTPSLIVCEQSDISRYGEVLLDKNKVTAFKEKSKVAKAGLINAGVYYLSKKEFSLVEKESFSLERDLLEKFISKISLRASITNEYFIDIGIPQDYEKAKSDLIK